jgi:hypothetical protein
MKDDKTKAAIITLMRNALLVHFERVTSPSPNTVQVVVPDTGGGMPRYFDIRIFEQI